MDMLTLARARKIAQALVNTLGEDVSGLAGDVTELTGDLDDLSADVVIVDADGDIASKLLINALRQHIWQNEAEALICEEGSKTLTNSRKFPFNNSQETVALAKTQRNTKYVVIAEVTTVAGNIGDVIVSDKQVNGFKLAFTGGASAATIKYLVIGGIIK